MNGADGQTPELTSYVTAPCTAGRRRRNFKTTPVRQHINRGELEIIYYPPLSNPGSAIGTLCEPVCFVF